MIKPSEIQKIATGQKVKDGQIEKDYILSWILFGISRNEFLVDALIFKGGTVLKKAYFEDYRFSEDLDFTLKNDKIDNSDIFREFDRLIGFIQEEANIPLRRDAETNFESGNMNFYLKYAGPLGGNIDRKDVKIDFTRNELVLLPVEAKPIFREYSDLTADFKVKCYSKAEVLVEKLRSIMERTQPRDIYDLWYLLNEDGIKIGECKEEFIRKTKHKGLDPEKLPDVLKDKENKFKSMWEKYLINQVHKLPEFDKVFRELSKNIRRSFAIV